MIALHPSEDEVVVDSSGLTWVGRKAGLGAALVAARSVIVQVISLLGMIVIARKLGPHELGLLALGLTVTNFAAIFADGGLAVGLIRNPRAPTRRTLRVTLGLQLTVTSAMFVLLSAALALVPRFGLITVFMLGALPLSALQTPAKVVLERELEYRLVAGVESGECLVYYAWAIGALLLGYGVWGVASASLVRAAFSAGALWAAVPRCRIMPAWSWRESGTLLRFGVQYQAVNVVNLVRDQGVNLVALGLVGVSGLGVWTLASRIMQAPLLLLGALWRVSYPAMARVVALDSQPRRLLERATGSTALVMTLLLSTLAGTSPALVPFAFGESWQGAAQIVLPSCIALMIGGPVSVATAGYLYAVGDTRAVLRTTFLHSCGWLLLSIVLVPVIGVAGIGVAWVGGSLIDASLLARAAGRHAVGIRLLPELVVPLVAGIFAAGAGWAFASQATAAWMGVLGGGAIAAAGYVGSVVLAARLGLIQRESSLGAVVTGLHWRLQIPGDRLVAAGADGDIKP
jgi:O-antigen/teichoic acid export membrane protein